MQSFLKKIAPVCFVITLLVANSSQAEDLISYNLYCVDTKNPHNKLKVKLPQGADRSEFFLMKDDTGKPSIDREGEVLNVWGKPEQVEGFAAPFFRLYRNIKSGAVPLDFGTILGKDIPLPPSKIDSARNYCHRLVDLCKGYNDKNSEYGFIEIGRSDIKTFPGTTGIVMKENQALYSCPTSQTLPLVDSAITLHGDKNYYYEVKCVDKKRNHLLQDVWGDHYQYPFITIGEYINGKAVGRFLVHQEVWTTRNKLAMDKIVGIPWCKGIDSNIPKK